MSVKGRRLAIWGLLLGLMAAGISYAFRPQPVPVDLATAETGLLQVTVDEEGETRVRDVYMLHAPLGGYLLRIEAEAGDPVEANVTQLARIEPAPPAFLDVRTEAEQQAVVEAAEAARDLAVAELDRAKADLAFAERDLDRAHRLGVQKTISQRAVDDAERAHHVAQANLATARAALSVRDHELRQARSRLLSREEMESRGSACECVPVTAPINGVVLRVLRKSEGVIDAGIALLEIGDPANLEVMAKMLSEDAVGIKPGYKAILAGWGGPDLEAVVRRIEPFAETKVSALGIEEKRAEVVLDLIDPPEGWRSLGHGYRVDVRVILFQGKVLQVPLGALFRYGDGWAVFVSDNDRALLRPVEVGERNSLSVEIRGGLSAGQRVVLYPSDRMSDGIAVVER